MHQTTGKELSIEEAVNAVASKFGGLVAKEPVGTDPQIQNPQQTANPEKTVVIKQNKTTIPSIGTSHQSPARKKLTSLDAIRKHAKTMED